MTDNSVQTLEQWLTNVDNTPSEMMHFHKSFWEQINFFRYIIPSIFNDLEEGLGEILLQSMFVVGTHTSKSVSLPVVQFLLNDGVTRVTIRGNFHDFKASIDSPRKIPSIFGKLFDSTTILIPADCEGFQEDVVYGSFEQSQYKFTVEISDYFKLYTFFWLLAPRV